MIIAVNTRLRKDEQPEGYESFMFEILEHVTRKFPEHQFLYVFDKPYVANRNFAKNVTTIVAGPETGSSLRLQYWFNYKIPAVLRKHKADVFVSMEGICSLRTKKPQCLLITDLTFLQQPQLLKRSQVKFYKKLMPAFLAKAKTIATVSEFSRSVIIDQYKINTADVVVINPGINEIFKPVDWEEKELIKERYAEGKAYFLFSGDIDQRSNLINLLKAFSFFKKRQKSNMLLLIAGNADEGFKKELKNYKFREEVKLLENLQTPELAKITAAAYALVYPVLYADLALPPLQAMQCGVPVVVSNTGSLPSICGEAALYVNPGDSQNIAENMMLVFKDEDKAKAMIQAGKAMLQQYQWDKSTDLLMQCILKCAE
ncbi:MAG: glycosyltransferase family 1 protein [Ferruginibacter sp.]